MGLWDLAHSYKHFPRSPIQQSACKPSFLMPYTTTVQQQSHQDIFLCWGSCWFKTFPSFLQLSCFTSSWDDMLGPGESWMQQTWGVGRLLQPSSLLPQLCLAHSLHLRQMNAMSNAFSLAFSCRKCPLNAVLSPVKLIMAKIGAAQAASELDSISGSHSAPDRPGNSAQLWVLWVKALLALTCPTQWLCCHC